LGMGATIMDLRSLRIGYRTFAVEDNGTSAAVTITIYAPHLDESPSVHERWICIIDVHDSVAGRTVTDRVYGGDSIQALHLGVMAFRMQVRMLKILYGQRITFDGEHDLAAGLEIVGE